MRTKSEMKDSRGSAANRFPGDYDTMRPLLRYISYGCYHKPFLVKRLGRSARTYEENMARLRFFLPEGSLKSSRQGRREIYRFEGDSYRITDDFLAYTYRLKALKTRAAFCLVGLLQLLGAAREPLDVTALFDYGLMSMAELPEGLEDLGRRTVQRYLQDLEAQGVVRVSKEGGRFLYRLADDPLAELAPEETALLCHAASFYRAMAQFSLPGCFLEDALQRRGQGKGTKPLAQVKHRATAQLLDDDALLQCLISVEGRREMTFDYGKKRREQRVVPLRLVSDMYAGRRYVLAACLPAKDGGRTQGAQMFRLDLMYKVRTGRAWTGDLPTVAVKEQELRLDFLPKGEKAGAAVSGRILARFPEAAIEEADGRLCVHLKVADALSLLPWLRTFWPLAHISLPQSPHLAERLKQDLKEALKNYGEHPALS